MARTDQQFPLRLPPELKEKLESACKESGRSKNAEAVYRLEKSFEPTINPVETYEFERMQQIRQQQADEIKALSEYIQDARETRMILIEFMNRNFEHLPVGLKSNFAKLVLEAAKSGESAPFDKNLELILKGALESAIERLEKYKEYGSWE